MNNGKREMFGDLSREDFLKNYWQKKPLLIRQAFPDYQSPLSAEEFAGLACEEGIESRLIQELGSEKPWQLRHGPFIESDFTSLPETHWTLLIQSVDHHIPALADLLDEFDFIPTWRIDDLMVSFAQAQGSVGAHVDNYDVFLLQVEGKRHWHINENEFSESDYKSDDELRLLSNFESEQDWVLEPGDMLYLPPGVAHHGIALDDCITFSIGFRAPTRKELLLAYTDKEDKSLKDAFYSDPDLQLQNSSGEITAEQICAIQGLMQIPDIDKGVFNSWFGCFITENKNNLEFENEEIDEEYFLNQFRQSGLTRNGNIRLAYILNEDSLSLFISGEQYNLSNSYVSLVSYICANHRLAYSKVIDVCDKNAASELLYKFYDENYFFFDE